MKHFRNFTKNKILISATNVFQKLGQLTWISFKNSLFSWMGTPLFIKSEKKNGKGRRDSYFVRIHSVLSKAKTLANKVKLSKLFLQKFLAKKMKI